VIAFDVLGNLGPKPRVIDNVRDGAQGGPIHQLEPPCKKAGGALLSVSCFQEEALLPGWDRPEQGKFGRAQGVSLRSRVGHGSTTHRRQVG
jgi:hypothetical protein